MAYSDCGYNHSGYYKITSVQLPFYVFRNFFKFFALLNMIVAVSYLILVSLAKESFDCPFNGCDISFLGDQGCDSLCNNKKCNFDSPDFADDRSEFEIFQSSDCYIECLIKGCTNELLKNTKCDTACNNIECAFDLGQCGFCASGCEEELIYNSVCDEKCAFETCNFDNYTCGFCAKDCFEEDLTTQGCKPECNTTSCSYSLENTCFKKCSENCPAGWLGDGICDDECNSAECKYDDSDCLCAPGCTNEMLSQDCTGLDDPCSTVDCGFKSGNCGYCASGCYFDELGDGVCNPECLNDACNNDYGDCECDTGCYMVYDGTSWTNSSENSDNADCFVPKCYYNIAGSSSTFLIRRYILTSLVKQQWTSIDLKNMTGDCTLENLTNYDDLSQYDVCNIDSDCYDEDGLWCMGSRIFDFDGCLRASDTKCLLCANDYFMVLGTCDTAAIECPLGYLLVDQLSELFNNDTDVLQWCLPDIRRHTSANPLVYYVNPTDNPSIGDEDGTEALPYESLFYAFTQIYSDFSEIVLKEGTHYYQYDSSIAQLYRADAYDPLRFTSMLNIMEIRIKGENPDNPSTLYWGAGDWAKSQMKFLKISSIARKFKLENLIIIGSKILVDCPFTNDLCYYCPAIVEYYDTNGDWHLLDDRQVIYNYSIEYDVWDFATQCSYYNNFEVFAFDYDAEISNVHFLNFTNQFKTLIKAKGKLSLTNTNFTNIQAKAGGNIIEITCTANCSEVDFEYITGVVQDINSGYEVTDSVQTGSFLTLNTIRNVEISLVEFKFCFMYCNSESAYESSLISVTKFNGTFSILNCSFTNIYANTLIDVDVVKLKYNDPLLFYGISLAYSQQHFSLQNTVFDYIYTSNNFINYQMKSMTHNILINNIEITNSNTGQSSFINLNYAGILKAKDKEEGKAIFDGIKYSIVARSVKLENLLFKNLTSGNYLINIYNNPNVEINNVTVDSVQDGSYLSLFDIITNFETNSKYLSLIPRSDLVEDLYCRGTLSLENCYNVKLTNLDISNVMCYTLYAPGGILMKNPENTVEITNCSFSNIDSESAEATAISISNTAADISINNLVLSNIRNFDGSILEFYKCSYIEFTNFTVNEIISSNSAPINVYEYISFALNSFEVTTSCSINGDGGFIQFMASTKANSRVDITDGIVSNSTSYGFGGVFIFDALTVNMLQNFTVTNIKLSNCYAGDGTFIYITRKINIDSSNISDIEATLLIGNGSLVLDMHIKGELVLENWFISESYLYTPGIWGSYNNEFSIIALRVINFTLFNCYYADCVFSFKAFHPETSIYFENVFISDVEYASTEQKSDTLRLNSIRFEAENFVIDNMNSFLYAQDVATVFLSNVKISNITQYVADISKSSYFECFSCNISENTGTIFTVYEYSCIYLENCLIFSNTYLFSSVSILEIDSLGDNPSKIYNSKISDNLSLYSDLIKLTNTLLEIEYSTISNNLAYSSIITGIFTMRSNLTITDSLFYYQKSDKFGAFVYGVIESYIVITGSVFNDSLVNSDGGAIYAKDCKMLEITNCVFIDNLALESGGAIYAENTEVIITSSIFKKNSAHVGSDLCFKNSSYTIKNSEFWYSNSPMKLSGQSMYMSGNKMKLENVILANTSRHISGLYAEGFKDIKITLSTFENIRGDSFGATNFVGNNKNGSVTISESKFIKNRGELRGGAILLNDMGLNVHNSYVYWNQAGVDGGGLYLTTPICQTCVFNLSGNSTFVRNHAQSEGGAMKWKDYKPYEGENVVIANNTAMYGGDRASSPATMGSKFGRLLTEENFTESIVDIPPGQLFNESFAINIYDTYGEIIVTDNTSELFIQPVSELFFLTGELTFTALEGTFYLSGFKPYGAPGSTKYIRAYTNSIKKVPVKNDDTVYQNDFYIRVDFRACVNGEQIGETSCLKCVEPRYLIEPAKTCILCPAGGECKGGDRFYVKKNYYRTNSLSHKVYPCQVDGVCLGNEEGYNTSCLDGYSGITCAVCDAGFTKAGNGNCNKCPSPALNFAILVGIIFGVIFICIVLVKSSIKSAFVAKAKHSIYIKIFTNYLQLVFLTAQFNLSWPSYVIVLFGIQKSAATATDSVFSIDCYISSNGEKASSDSYFFKMIFYAVLPLGIFIISILVWICICLMKESYVQLKRELPLTMIVIFFLVYPNIVKFMFSHFACTEFDMLGKFLNDNYSVECWNDKHQRYSVIVALPSIIIWSVGVPTVVLIAMIKQRRYLYKEDNKIRFGFLFNGYKTSIFYWEFIIMYRKILIICVIVFIADISTAVQGLTVTLILIFSLFIQYEIGPYNSNELNHMEVEALITASLTIYCGLYYLTQDIGEIFKLVLFIIIVFCNCYFLILWLYWMIKAVMDMVVKLIPALRHTFKKGDAFEEEFNREELVIKGTYFDHSDQKRHYTLLSINNPEQPDFKYKGMQDLYKAIFEDCQNEEDFPTDRSYQDDAFDNEGRIELHNRKDSAKILPSDNSEQKVPSIKSNASKKSLEKMPENERKPTLKLPLPLDKKRNNEKMLTFKPEELKRDKLRRNSLAAKSSEDEPKAGEKNEIEELAFNNPENKESHEKGKNNFEIVSFNSEKVKFQVRNKTTKNPSTEVWVPENRMYSIGAKLKDGEPAGFVIKPKVQVLDVEVENKEQVEDIQSPLIQGGSVYISEADDISPGFKFS